MNGIKKMQCKDIEKMLILSLDNILEILEYTIQDVKERNLPYCSAKKMANKYIPIMLRNNNRLREFRLFMKENDIEISNIDLSERVNTKVDFFC